MFLKEYLSGRMYDRISSWEMQEHNLKASFFLILKVLDWFLIQGVLFKGQILL